MIRAGPVPMHVDLARQEHRLIDRMGDQHDGLMRALPDVEQALAHLLAGDGVERAERFVHQQHFGIERQRPRDRDALPHAAGQLRGTLLLGILRARRGAAWRAARVHGFAAAWSLGGHQQKRGVLERVLPGQQRRVLEHEADDALP